MHQTRISRAAHPCEAWLVFDTHLQRAVGVGHYDLGGTLTPGLVSVEELDPDPEIPRARVESGVRLMNALVVAAALRRIRYESPQRFVRLCIVHQREVSDSLVESDERPACPGH